MSCKYLLILIHISLYLTSLTQFAGFNLIMFSLGQKGLLKLAIIHCWFFFSLWSENASLFLNLHLCFLATWGQQKRAVNITIMWEYYCSNRYVCACFIICVCVFRSVCACSDLCVHIQICVCMFRSVCVIRFVCGKQKYACEVWKWLSDESAPF